MASGSTSLTASPQKRSSPAMMGGLLGAFVIVSVECQRHWPAGASLLYLAIGALLLVVWLCYLAGWPQATEYADQTLDGSILALLASSVFFRFAERRGIAEELAATLLFWAPLIAAWWGWRYQSQVTRLAALLAILFGLLIWQTAGPGTRIHEHLILALLVTLVVRQPRPGQPAATESSMNLRDPLTGLASAECFEAELAHVSAISDRYQLPLTLIGCRITAAGSALTSQREQSLRDYAEAISDRLRNSDTACRWDETTIMILLPNTAEKQSAIVAGNIERALHKLVPDAGRPSATIACVEHQAGEDPMSTLGALEIKLAALAGAQPD